jgi:predicted Zn finger-like uncharacterized protein
MRIVCPACEATYNVPDAKLATGARKVRCAKCGNEWVPTPEPPHEPLEFEPAPSIHDEPPADFPALPPVPETDPYGRHEPRLKPLRTRPERVAEPTHEEPPPPRGRRRAVVAWLLTVLVLAAAGAAAVQWRSDVMSAWPPSERVYSAVGLR